MAGLAKRSFDSPDESRPVADKGRIDILRLDGTTMTRGTFLPGWRWSEHVRPSAGTESCLVRHQGVVLSGRLHVAMDDGTEGEAGPGEAFLIEPGHDAWVVGDDPCVFIDFSPAMEGYARRG